MKKLKFCGYTWLVRDDFGKPGPNEFSHKNAWLDKEKNLHLKISKINNLWKCAEVYLDRPLGYGVYNFEIEKPIFLHKNVVLGLFTYQDDSNEIDMEFGRWGFPFNLNAQYAVQPWNNYGNAKRFLSFSGKISISFNWQKDGIEFKSSCMPFRTSWIYRGKDIPSSIGKERVHMNLWIFGKHKPKKEQQVIIKKFEFEK